MKTEDLVFNLCCNRQALKEVGEHFPNEVGSVFSEALIIESVEFVDLSIFMVASEDGDSGFVLDFEQKYVEEGLDAVESSVNKVAEKEVVCIRTFTANFEQLNQIIELSMNITNNFYWRL